MYKTMSKGEKIKYLRKKLHITQNTLAGKKLTKSYISKAEHNQVKITKDIAKFICKKVNYIAAKNNIYFDFAISEEWLLEDEKTQVSKIIDNYINNFKIDPIVQYLKLSNMYSLDSKYLKICKCAIRYYFYESYNKKSLEFVDLGLNKIMHIESSASSFFYIYKVNNLIELKDYDNALKNSLICQTLLDKYDKSNIKYFNTLYYNFALIYINMDKINTALDYYNKINIDFLNNNQKIDVIIQKTNCNFRLKNYNSAIKQYKKIITFYDINENLKARCYRNISESFYNLKEFDNALFYIQKCISIRYKIKNIYLTENLRFNAEIYISMNLLDKAEKKLLQAYEIKKENETIEKLINLYILKKENTIKIENEVNKVKHLSATTLKNLALYYLKIDSEKSYYYLSLLKI